MWRSCDQLKGSRLADLEAEVLGYPNTNGTLSEVRYDACAIRRSACYITESGEVYRKRQLTSGRGTRLAQSQVFQVSIPVEPLIVSLGVSSKYTGAVFDD